MPESTDAGNGNPLARLRAGFPGAPTEAVLIISSIFNIKYPLFLPITVPKPGPWVRPAALRPWGRASSPFKF